MRLSDLFRRHAKRTAVHFDTCALSFDQSLSPSGRYKSLAQFVIFQSEVGPSGHVLHHVATLHSPPWDLVDFAVTANSIWTVSTTPEGENVVRYAVIDG